MKWHKISDGDYPEIGRYVLIASTFNNEARSKYFYTVAWIERMGDNRYMWVRTEGHYSVFSTDRWAYIDLPTD